MPATSREIVKQTILFRRPERLAYDLPEEYGSDIVGVGMVPSPEDRPVSGRDEWGAVWENIGVSKLGEVKDHPLKSWDEFDKLNIPDVTDPKRWEVVEDARGRVGEKFMLGCGITLYERVHFLRGLENTWADMYENPDKLKGLIDILVEMSLEAITRYAAAGCDGYMWCDDWGLQDRLMISPESWREFWKPRYARVYEAAHKAGMLTLLHSCGYIVDILDDLIEVGLDVIQMDQQENMTLELLGERFGGRITFWCPVDIQGMMVQGSLDEIREYCWKLARLLGRENGGFIAKWYPDPDGAGHRAEAIKAMSEEFLKIPVGGVEGCCWFRRQDS